MKNPLTRGPDREGVLSGRGYAFGVPGMYRAYTIATFSVAIVMSTAGCATWTPETRVEEGVYQVLGAADTLQTLQGLKHPECYAEENLLGSHPSTAQTVAWGTVRGLLHWYVTDQLEVNDVEPVWKRLWQGLTIAYQGHVVSANWQLGAKPWSASCP